MNKTAIKNFAIWARNKLIADITYKAGLLGISEKGIKSSLPQSTNGVQFFDIGTKEPYSISGIEIRQREALAEAIRSKEQQSDYATAYKSVVEEVAYTWFNRLIAVRFMEVNDYLPSHIRVLSSESSGKDEPDLVTNPFDTDLEFTPYEKDRIMQLKQDNKLDELFRMLFIKQCNTLNAILPNLFEQTSDYTESLLNVAFTDKDGVVYRLIHDIPEDDFNVSKEGQVEIIGWLYQYYNTEPKQAVFDGLKKNIKITKETIPAATQLFTPDWIVRYMVENSLGRLWLESHPNSTLRNGWKYYLDEAEQTPEVAERLRVLRTENAVKSPEDIKVIDPCMGSGHILVYAFDVLMQIYTSEGYSERDAAKLILEKNIYGLEIDRRAYQLAYFALMMKARQYNRRILMHGVCPQVYEPTGYGEGMEYGSLVSVHKLEPMPEPPKDQLTLFAENYETMMNTWHFRKLLAHKYDVVLTNPPYMGSKGMSAKLSEYVQKNYPDSKNDLFAAFIERCTVFTKQNGYCGMVTMQSWMFLSSFNILRKRISEQNTICSLVHIGYNSFPEINSKVAQAVSFILSNNRIQGYYGSYLDLTNKYPQAFDKESAYFQEIEHPYIVCADTFSKIPGMTTAYWVSKKAISNFEGSLLGGKVSAVKGLDTCDNEVFVRDWPEVDIRKIGLNVTTTENTYDQKWFPYSKGGGYRKWYGFNEKIVNWENDGNELKNLRDMNGKIKSRPQNIRYYFKEGITWSTITSYKLSMRYMKDSIFGGGGSALFTKESLMYILGFINSKVAEYYLGLLNPTLNFLVGDILSLPIVTTSEYQNHIENIVRNNICISKENYNSFETSWEFRCHPFIKYKNNGLISNAFKQWDGLTENQFIQLKANEEELNRIFIDVYGLQDELISKVDNKDITISKADLGRDIRSFISYSVGCMFGRYSLDVEGLAYAGGQWDKEKYRTFIPNNDNILPITDEEYFEDDIVGLFVAFVKKVYGAETLVENLDFIAKALGNKGNTALEIIRNYFVKDFFKDYCKIYQKRPIYWLFDSGKADGFKALIYIHRYDENTIGKIRVDYLHKMQRIYEREIARMQEIIENSTNSREVAAAEKRKDKLIKQLKETKDYDEKIAHLALARIAIDLDDGVKANYEKVQIGTDGKKLEVLAKI